MNKPQMKQEAAVDAISADGRVIWLYCQPDAVSDFEEFGTISKWVFKNQYMLTIDPRFDSALVVAYINGYGKEPAKRPPKSVPLTTPP